MAKQQTNNNKMTKNQKMLLGVGAVATVGYLVYKQMSKGGSSTAPQPAATFASATGSMTARPPKRNPNGTWSLSASDGSYGTWYPRPNEGNPKDGLFIWHYADGTWGTAHGPLFNNSGQWNYDYNKGGLPL